VPAWVNLKLNDPAGEIVPLPNELPVTVCGAEVVLFQITVVPAVIFRACGLNAKVPLLCVVIVTTTVGAGVGVGVGVGDGAEGLFVVPTIVVLAFVGADVAVAVLLFPPHAAKIINSAANKRLYQAMRTDTYMFLSIQCASSRLLWWER